MQQVRNALRKAGDMIGQVDDKVQGAARYVLGERDGKFQGSGNLATAAATYGAAMHGSRQGVTDDWKGKAYLAGTRGAQAGAITAAGYGLVQLAEQFGGPADTPEPNQLTLR